MICFFFEVDNFAEAGVCLPDSGGDLAPGSGVEVLGELATAGEEVAFFFFFFFYLG